MNKKYVWTQKLSDEKMRDMREKWDECMGTPSPLGAALFATISFKTGTLRLMALQPAETEILRRATNQIALQTVCDDLDAKKK